MYKKYLVWVVISLVFFVGTSTASAGTYLIWDPCESTSGEILHSLLQSQDYEGEIITDIGDYLDDLNRYKPVFVIADWWCDGFNFELLDGIAVDIHNYVLNGGSIYWQGENTPLFHDFYRDTLFQYDIATCATNPSERLWGCSNSPFDIEISTNVIYAEMVGGGDGCAFEGEDICWCKAVYRETPFKTIITTFPISGLTDGGPDSRADFVNVLMGWLDAPNDVPKLESADIPENYTIMQNYPNPFNAQTRLNYTVPKAGRISIVIYNILGRPVEVLFKGYQAAGQYSLTWDATDYSTGIYFARLENGRYAVCAKMVLMK